MAREMPDPTVARTIFEVREGAAVSEPMVWHDESERLEVRGTLDPPDACMCRDCNLPAAALDPRWEWVEAPRSLCSPAPTYVKGRCLHTEVVPVEAGGEVVAHLCLTCDEQLPEEWKP